jgi:hypothetical protein
MAISSAAPIARFGRWLETLSFLDVLVISVVSPVLGLASVVGPAWLSASEKPSIGDLLKYSIEYFDPRAIIFLCLTGAIVALLSRRLGVWAASTAMFGYFLWVLSDMGRHASGHKLLPFELGFYCVLTAFAIAGAGMVALVRA